MSIVFFTSGHGFGHASRDVEVLNLLGAGTDRRLIIRSAVSPHLLERTLRVPYELRPGICDTGISQATSIASDDAATVEAAEAFYRDLASRIDAEVAALAHDHVALVVGDIPPMACAVAARLGVPGVALGNFTWDWIYETHPGFLPRAGTALAAIRGAYRQATLALELPFSGGFEIFEHVTRVPLISRRPTQSRTTTRAHFGLPAHGRVALLSFGGYGLPSLDLGRVAHLDDWTIVTTDRVTADAAAPRNVVRVREPEFLTSAVRYEDLVAAVDVVVTKPGYGIIAECIASGTAMIYTSRGAFREYDVLVSALPRYVRARFLAQDALYAGAWRAALEAVLADPAPPERLDTNGAEVVAGILADLARP